MNISRLITIFKVVFSFLFIFPAMGETGKSQENDEILNRNHIFKESIRTVQFFRKGWEFSHPVIRLNSEQQLLLKFDDLSDEPKDYIYTITHCDYTWRSSNLNTNEFMGGFPENQIYDYEYSFNTTTGYINYHLSIPNDDITLKLSGNYLLKVWDSQNRDTPVLVRRFFAVENGTSISGEVKRATFDGYRGANQEVDFSINYANLHIPSPISEVKVVVMQNFRYDNAITDLPPQFVRENILEYNYNQENVFPGGNEFRNFDSKDLKINGRGVYATEYFDPLFHVTLLPDEITRQVPYKTDEDLNGRFLPKRDRAEDSDIEADYIFAHFTLYTETPLLGGETYVFGELTNWQCNTSNKMIYNIDKQRYEASILLKQGFYDYQYAYIEKGSQQINTSVTEGSHFETENEYQIFVYFSAISSRYDRLIGFHKINSVKR
jgi:hypothetical protein